ncbi:MAG: hypothetical protein H6668_19845 [Ardenticatenaceae bacterium]|nr:hypothetical protein [Ardenticatenaceae bacterium]
MVADVLQAEDGVTAGRIAAFNGENGRMETVDGLTAVWVKRRLTFPQAQ